jgi:hypothetical protein
MVFLPVVFGIKKTDRRESFPEDYVAVQNKPDTQRLHKFNGQILGFSASGDRQTYDIDGVVEVSTISAQKQKEVVSRLSSEYSMTKYATAGLGSIFVGGLVVYSQFYLAPHLSQHHVLESVLVGSGVASCIGLWRTLDYHSELKKWSKSIADHCKIRQNLRNYREIFDNNYRGRYLTVEEAATLWKQNVWSYNSDLRYVRDYAGFNKRLEKMLEFKEDHPLKSKYMTYFSDGSINLEMTSVSSRLGSIEQFINFVKDAIEDKKIIAHYRQNDEIKAATVPHKVAEAVLDTTYIYDKVTEPVNEPVNRKVAKEVGYVVGSAAIEKSKEDVKKSIRQKYENEIQKIEQEENFKIVNRLPEVQDIYEDFLKKYGLKQ